MAVIDFKNAAVLIQDGSPAPTTAVTTTLKVAAVAGDNIIELNSNTNFQVGNLFTFAGEPRYYYVNNVVVSGTHTYTHILPRLFAATASGATITQKFNVIEVKVGEGNLTYSEKRAITYVKNRGFLDTCKLGDEDPMEIALDFTWEFLLSPSGNPPKIEEALKGIGNAATWVSTSPDPCEPYCVDITILYVPPCGDYESITLPQFRYESLDHDIKAGRVAIKGNCNNRAAVVVHTGTAG